MLAHAGGARLDAGNLTAIGRTDVIGDPPYWDADAPLLWLFNLHYFGWLDALPHAEQRRLVLDWIERYRRAARGPAGGRIPSSLRLRHWARALFDGQALAAERPRVLASLEAQAECLADTLEHHLRGNHLLESGITLKLVAACVRGPAVARWERLADRVLDVELTEQFLLDGGHFERSPMYHALLVHGLLDLVNVLPEEDEQRARLVERLPGLLHFLAGMRHPDGEIALFSDAAFGIAPEPGALLDYAARLGIKTTAFASGSFPVTGYHVWRRGGDALVVDAGPIGPGLLVHPRARRHLLVRAEPRRPPRRGRRRHLDLRGRRRARLGALDARAQHGRDRRRRPVRVLRRLPRRAPRPAARRRGPRR